ncbi:MULTISPECIES: ATP-NAD kinase family protein [Pseudoalteromonas]|jgi:predicted polyphosphate/ATP-dependent NAD kinase|uniref:ATP-NAD kinase family protein n=1 Tax=Pseudoalteromonas TaxID=53246 RepID=UPI0011934908|nr:MULTISPECIES: ATP-NAD kinase family protein [Pseudoalteromonas]MBB1277997.1 ATP-NAD kinase family protein [Pseudoalteromonas sp. SR43-3]MBB1306164.1 ATP-NAD kinase family protein [Pseudoalteromonas sp. SR43-5]MBB1345410.1 ATP-NAD kinase family protein [Pseudoalteromonas sp. SG45-2]MBB1348645.1 ATP-NAD kinase family protein [Pseudoalteromonas sp. SG45-3]MBB1359689.1 ATP-NAD kinase family protein [Pseudoalteromonas sp. SG45-6]|tara:strand:+ start:31455 stop:32618 length:1164 start_codon:yes stop_codon:yes gene_type:complete
MAFKLGLIVNPVAGLGGTVALKGSDGAHTAAKAIELGAEPKANSRTKAALEVLLPYKERLTIYTVNGDMGEQTAKALGFNVEVVYNTSAITTPDDTEQAAKILKNSGVDLVLFAGGDGTARNICHAIEDTIPVLGIPAGCKIHSGVYAITPKAAGRVVEMLVKGELVTLADADVMDIDEDAFRQGTVKAKRYGEMQTPSEVRYMQAVKNGGKETDELVLADIAAHVVSQMDEDTFYIMGSGSTVEAIMEEMGLENTLLGVDLIKDQTLVAQDLTAKQLLELTHDQSTKLVITLIGGQGHIFGRGNQQLSPLLIRAIGKENIIVVATKTKLLALNGRPLICDTGDGELDDELTGYIKVTTGFNDHIMYAVGHQNLENTGALQNQEINK